MAGARLSLSLCASLKGRSGRMERASTNNERDKQVTRTSFLARARRTHARTSNVDWDYSVDRHPVRTYAETPRRGGFFAPPIPLMNPILRFRDASVRMRLVSASHLHVDTVHIG